MNVGSNGAADAVPGFIHPDRPAPKSAGAASAA